MEGKADIKKSSICQIPAWLQAKNEKNFKGCGLVVIGRTWWSTCVLTSVL